ncbi:MAG: cyclase/dehydrase [Bacteroidetes bacterium]|nr:cyclase/dehydrase [Bacteroidota bacterium]
MSKPSPDKTIHAGTLTEKTSFINVSNSGRLSSAVIASWLFNNSVSHWKKHSTTRNLLQLGAAGYLLYRGLSGNCPISAAMGVKGRHNHSINIRETFIVQHPRELVYYAWSQLEDLPLFLQHVREITVTGEGRSHWVIDTPKGLPTIEWDAEIVEDHEGEMFSWRSLPGSSIETAGKVLLREFPGDSTQVKVMISYRPPAGFIGSTYAKLFTPAFEKMVKEDIANFQEYIDHFHPEIRF